MGRAVVALAVLAAGMPLPHQPAATDASTFGGTPGRNEAAREDLWPRILRCFARL